MPDKKLNKWVRFSGMGFQMGFVIFLGVWGGSKLDEKFPNEHKIWTIVLSLLSVFIALYLVIREVKQLTKNDDSDS